MSEFDTFHKQMEKISRRDALKVILGFSGVATLVACGADAILNSDDESSSIPNAVNPGTSEAPLVLPTSTDTVKGFGQYEFITQSEIETKLKGPFDAFKADQNIKDLFTDPSTIEYSAAGVKIFDAGGQPTAYTFFSAVSETEEKGRTAMVFGGDEGEVIYLVLNRMIDNDGKVGLGITQDPATGLDLEKPVMIFNTELSEAEVAKMTNEELESRNILFIPAGIPIPTKELFGGKAGLMAPVEAPAPVEQIDISNPETFRTVEWDYLTSPAYLAELKQKEVAGLLPKVPDDPAYIENGFVSINNKDTKSENLKFYGYETIFSLSNESAYLDINKRPFTLVDICKTSFEGVDMIFFVNKWTNSDGTSGFLAHFVPDYQLIKDVGLDTIVGRDKTQYPTGGFFIKTDNIDGLKLYLDQWAIHGNDYARFAEYYYSHPEIFFPKEIYENWKLGGNLVTQDVLPISPAGSNKITN